MTGPRYRVAMIGTRGVPSTFGGVERAVEEVGAGLAQRGHYVTVYCRTGYSDRMCSYRGMQLRHLPALNTKHMEAVTHTFLAVVDAVRRRYDVIHIHATGPALFAFLARLGGARVVVTVQGLDYERAKWGPVARQILRLGVWAAAHLPHATVVVSRALQGHLRRHYRIDATYIPNGVELPDEPLLAGDDGYVLFLGRIVPEKRIHDVVDAFRSMGGTARLRIVGPASHTADYLARLRDLAAGDARITIEEPVYGSAKSDLLQRAAVVVYPSELEGLPLALLEGMAHARCVLASDIAPHREAIPAGAGVIYPVGDRVALIRELERLLGDPSERLTLGRAARDHVGRRYSWDDVIADTEQLYRRLVEAR